MGQRGSLKGKKKKRGIADLREFFFLIQKLNENENDENKTPKCVTARKFCKENLQH